MAANPRVTWGIFLSGIMTLIIGAGAFYAKFGDSPNVESRLINIVAEENKSELTTAKTLTLEKPETQILAVPAKTEQPLLIAKPTPTSNYGAEIYYGRWTIIWPGQSLKETCAQYSTTYSAGQSIYVGPDDPNGLFRSVKLSVSGSTLIIDELGNAGEEDARETYKIINRNTLRGIKTEITSHRGGKKPVAMMDGTIMKRCPTLASEPSSVPTTGSASSVEEVTAFSQARAYDCSEKTYPHARTTIMVAFGTGILQNDPSGGVSVLVADDYWRRLTFPEKIRFAEEIVCAAAGVDRGAYGLTLKSLSTGKVIGEWGPFGVLSVP